MHVPVCVFILLWRFGLCQRYAERNPLPPPFEDAYDEYYSEGYDFEDNADIFRWNVEDFPHPLENFRFCNRLKASYICDPDMILQKEQADKLESFSKQLYKETPCICDRCDGEEGGIIIGIALLKRVFQPYNEHHTQTIRQFAERLREKWKLGKCDNDILILVATDDRLSYTDVGRATSAYVSLQEAYRIFLENKSNFSAGNFYEGLNAMLTDYYKKTRNMRRDVDNKIDVGLIAGSIIGAVLIAALIILIIALVYRNYKRTPRKAPGDVEGKSEGVPSSTWTKQDIKVMFGSFKSTDKSQSAKYQPCETDEKEAPLSSFKIDEEDEVIDTSLASADSTHVTNDTSTTSASELLGKELDKAVEGLSETFKPKPKYNKHETDL